MAAVARALSRRQLCSAASSSATRCFSASAARGEADQPPQPSAALPQARTGHVHTRTQTPKQTPGSPTGGANPRKGKDPGGPKMAPRLTHNATKFYAKTGLLTTTPENLEFLRETGIEHDHAKMWTVTHPAARKATRDFGVSVHYSDRYVIRPWDLKKFEPRGHSSAPTMRATYRLKLEEEPLWVYSLAPWSGLSAVVRMTCTRRLAAAVHLAAKQLAEANPPVRVHGTVLLVVRDVEKAVNRRKEDFQEAMVVALREEMRKLGRKGNA